MWNTYCNYTIGFNIFKFHPKERWTYLSTIEIGESSSSWTFPKVPEVAISDKVCQHERQRWASSPPIIWGEKSFLLGGRESCLSLHQPITIVLHIRSLCRHFRGGQWGWREWRWADSGDAETIPWFWGMQCNENRSPQMQLRKAFSFKFTGFYTYRFETESFSLIAMAILALRLSISNTFLRKDL